MKFFLALYIITSTLFSYSQNKNIQDFDEFSYGFGIGLEHGGLIGINISYYALPNLGLFGGLGYSFPGAGYNFGVKARVRSKTQKSSLSPYFFAMYGINAAIITEYKYARGFKGYAGPSLGVGLDLGPKISKSIFLNFSMTYPIRDKRIRELDFYPITFGIGIKFLLSKHD